MSYKFFCTNPFLKLLKHKLEFLTNSFVQIPLIKIEFLRNSTIFRSSHRRCSIEKSVLKNFVIFTGKQLCWSLFFNKAADLQACNFIKRRLQYRCFLVSITKFLRMPILKDNCKWQLLNFQNLFSKNLLGANFLHPYCSD